VLRESWPKKWFLQRSEMVSVPRSVAGVLKKGAQALQCLRAGRSACATEEHSSVLVAEWKMSIHAGLSKNLSAQE
jgi:hypothetical protein